MEGMYGAAADVDSTVAGVGRHDIENLFDINVVCKIAAPRIVDDELCADEYQHIKKSCEKRRAEFGVARLIAREALSVLGAPQVSLLPKADRSPTWPEGIVGSISHTNDICAAVVARSKDVVSIGLDLEQGGELGEGIVKHVCSPEEIQENSRITHLSTLVLAKLIFSAKEAFYKCQYPLSNQFLSHREIELQFIEPGNRFVVVKSHAANSNEAMYKQIRGTWKIVNNTIITAASLS